MKRKKRTSKNQKSMKSVQLELCVYARKLGLEVVEEIGLNADTLKEAKEIVYGAKKYLKMINGSVSFSSSEETGIYLTIIKIR